MLSGWTKVWLDFRDAYGLAWGVRVMERIEALLQSSGVPTRLQWNGFRSAAADFSEGDDLKRPHSALDQTDAAAAPDLVTGENLTMAAVEPGIRNLLRRFVSNEWIDSRSARCTLVAGHTIGSYCKPHPFVSFGRSS